MNERTQQMLRRLPSVDEVLGRPELMRLLEQTEGGVSRPDLTTAVRAVIADRRAALIAGTTQETEITSEEVTSRAKELVEPSLMPVINATGVVVHTNLGRSPLPAEAVDRLAEIASGYSNLEYDLDAGRRGHRHAHATALLGRVTGAEAALVVNNCAAAVLLCLAGLARDREVVVSRGELVEIGGSFRVPDVMRQSGAHLREVGTTNRTRLDDYSNAITAETALLLKVHRSNFAVVGFTEEVSARDLATLGHERGVLTMMDLGSGLLGRPPSPGGTTGFREELEVGEVLGAGVDLVTFSGDKLLGGPQAGIVAGRADLVGLLARHPLLRALRPDKLTFAALEAVLALHAAGQAAQRVPTVRMLHEDRAQVTKRRDELLGQLAGRLEGGLEVAPTDLMSRPGGGSSPQTELPSAGIVITHPQRSAEQLATGLRAGRPPVIGRIDTDRLILDLRTVLPDQLEALAAAIIGLAETGSAST